MCGIGELYNKFIATMFLETKRSTVRMIELSETVVFRNVLVSGLVECWSIETESCFNCLWAIELSDFV